MSRKRYTDLGLWNLADYNGALASVLAEIEDFGGGTLWVPGGGSYTISTGGSYDVNAGPLTILAHAAQITYTGSGSLLTVHADGSQTSGLPQPQVYGGHWQGSASGQACFQWDDIRGGTMRDVRVSGFSSGVGLLLRNVGAWSEQNTFDGLGVSGCRHAIRFDPAAVTGGAGTSSFARTRVRNMRVGGGASGQPLIWCRGSVYHSLFDGIMGNPASGVTMMHLDGAMDGTRIDQITGEGGAALFSVGTLASKPSIGRAYALAPMTVGLDPASYP